ncbi:NEDD4-binding protein 2 [Lissotriton helveticus]
MPRERKPASFSPTLKPLSSQKLATFSACPGKCFLWPTDSLVMYQDTSGTREEDLLSSMLEMFSGLDPGVVYMVLSESDFKVEVAMDYLLELSTAAKGTSKECCPDGSGFDSIAISLEDAKQAHFVEGNNVLANDLAQFTSSVDTDPSASMLLTKEFDILIQNEFEKCSRSSHLSPCNSDTVRVSEPLDYVTGSSELPRLGSSSVNLNSMQENDKCFDCFSFRPSQNRFASFQPELVKWSVQTDDATVDTSAFSGELELNCQGSTLSDNGAFSKPVHLEGFQSDHLNKDLGNKSDSFQEQHCNQPILPVLNRSLTLEQSGIPFLSQQDDTIVSSNPPNKEDMSSIVHGAPNTDALQSENQFSSQLTAWNPLASEFYPSSYHNFITPVAFSPGHWTPALNQGGYRRSVDGSPEKCLNAWVSNPFTSKVQGQESGNHKMPPLNQSVIPSVKKKKRILGKVLLLLRGAPGSGKSTLARMLLEQNPGGIVLCTDDYFCKNGQYQYDRNCLEEAHAWNQKKAKEAFMKKLSPIIIDNTNLRAWEMKPYVTMAVQHKYTVAFREPDTWWKYKAKELERRNIHGITKEKIKRMLNSYEQQVSVNSIMNSSACNKPEKSDLDQTVKMDKADGKTDTKAPASSKEEKDQRVEDKHVVRNDLTLFLETDTGQTTEDLYNQQKDMENETENAAVNSGLAQEDSTISSSGGSCPRQDLSVGSQCIKKNENVDKIVAINSSGCVSSEETVVVNTLPVPKKTAHSASGPSETSPDIERSTIISCSLRPELLNFVGDWPVEQSMGQRTQRIKRTTLSKTNCDLLKAVSLHPVESSTQAGEESEGSLINISAEPLHKETVDTIDSQDGSEIISEPVMGSDVHDVNDAVITDLKNNEGDWPTTLTLEHRQKLNAQNTSLNKNVESGNMLNSSDSYPDVDLQGTSDNTRKQMVAEASTFQDDETATSENNPQKSSSQNRKASKPCKLAFTFTKNSTCLSEWSDPLLTGNLEGDISESKFCASSQTEPQEFALLWRLEKKITNVSEFSKVLIGKVDRFQSSNINITTDAECQETIPYRVMHDKGTYVEESELIEEDNIENLKDLCRMFRSVSFDVLKDLYERCNKDIGWATNLLLDSGEKLHREDDLGGSYHFDSDQTNLTPDVTVLQSSKQGKMESCEENSQTVSQFKLDYELDMKEFDHVHVDQAIFEPQLRLHSGNKDNREILEDTNELAKYKQLSNHSIMAVFASTGSEIREVTPETKTEEDFVMSQPSSDAVTELCNMHDHLYSIDMEVLEKNSPQTSVYVDAHIGLQNFDKHEDHPLLEELEIQGINVMSACSLANISLSEKFSLNDTLSNISGESEINKSFSEDFEKFQVEHDICPVGQNPEALGNPQHHIVESRNACIDKLDEVNKMHFQESRINTPNSNNFSRKSMNIDCLQLSLPPELAFQLSELFGPVGIGLGSLTVEDCVVHIDLDLAKVIHEKWKESIMERQQQEALSYQLIMEDEQFCTDDKTLPRLPHYTDSKAQELSASSVPELVASETMCASAHQHEISGDLPFMDHWNTRTQKVSLRKIMSEEVAFQQREHMKQFSPQHRKDGATIVKEKQLLQMFPNIDQKLLLDIFQESNFSLEQTETFFNYMLEADPVQNVVAPEIGDQRKLVQSVRTTNSKEKRTKAEEESLCGKSFQDIADPEYADFRTEAFLHRSKQQECFRKAAEAYRRGMKEVATFYAQQGHLHGVKVKEANHLAALQIFNRVNESLLPENVLDLHGLHVDEAIDRMCRILQEKGEEYKCTGGKPYLSVITGRGNHSQGGVPRIKPAVIDYLTSHNFRFKEVKAGCIQVMLK